MKQESKTRLGRVINKPKRKKLPTKRVVIEERVKEDEETAQKKFVRMVKDGRIPRPVVCVECGEPGGTLINDRDTKGKKVKIHKACKAKWEITKLGLHTAKKKELTLPKNLWIPGQGNPNSGEGKR